jgi:hypothetical protein
MNNIMTFGFVILIIFVAGFVLSSSETARPLGDYMWMGPTGAPLPFGSFEDAEEFLMASEVIRSKMRREGVNKYKKVVLDFDGVWANSIFRWESEVKHPDSNRSRQFRDSYESELAAYKVNKILGLNNIPPTVYRDIGGRYGSLQLWIENSIKEVDRREKDTTPPDLTSWNRQSHDMRVFDNLINNVERNQNNILIDENWNLWLIDHTRSFAMNNSLPTPQKISRCSRSLYNALKQIDEDSIKMTLSSLQREEVDAFFARRDKLIQLLEDRIKEFGESKVLYD